MIRSEVRARVAANQPDGRGLRRGPTTCAKRALPRRRRSIDLRRRRVRVASALAGANSRKAAIVLGLAALAASPAAYRYLQREFGPDPFAGIKLDGVRIDAISGIAEVVKPPEAKPSAIKPVPRRRRHRTAPPKPRPSRPSASAAGPAVAAPAAPGFRRHAHPARRPLAPSHTADGPSAPKCLQEPPRRARTRARRERHRAPAVKRSQRSVCAIRMQQQRANKMNRVLLATAMATALLLQSVRGACRRAVQDRHRRRKGHLFRDRQRSRQVRRARGRHRAGSAADRRDRPRTSSCFASSRA